MLFVSLSLRHRTQYWLASHMNWTLSPESCYKKETYSSFFSTLLSGFECIYIACTKDLHFHGISVRLLGGKAQ